MKYLGTIIFLTILLTSCKTQKSDSPSTGDCKLENTEWLEVSNGYDSKTVLELASKFEAAAKADVEKLKGLPVDGSGNVGGSFTSDFVKVVNSNSAEKVTVSQEFYENYRSKRDALCNILFLLNDVTLTSIQRDKMITSYSEINSSFAAIKDKEEKKSQN